MGTFAAYLKQQNERQDRVGYAARAWESAQIGRISTPTSIIRKMEEFANEAKEAGNDERAGNWSLAALGAREAAEEYRRRPSEDDSHPAPPHERVLESQVALPTFLPPKPPNASSGATVAAVPADKPAQADVAGSLGRELPQPPEGGQPIAVVRVSTSAEPARHGPPPGTPAARDEAYARIERALAEVAAQQAVNHDLLVTIAEYLVIKGDQEGLRTALSRALAGDQGRISHPSLNWSQMWLSADHSAATPGEPG